MQDGSLPCRDVVFSPRSVQPAAGCCSPRTVPIVSGSHLLLFTTREDPQSDELGEQLAERLRTLLPESRARVARAPHIDRMASLLVSGQADTAVIAHEHARQLLAGAAPFESYGPIALCALGRNDRYVLACRGDLKPDHAFLIAQALCSGESAPLVYPAAQEELPPHAGALAAASGQPPEQ